LDSAPLLLCNLAFRLFTLHSSHVSQIIKDNFDFIFKILVIVCLVDHAQSQFLFVFFLHNKSPIDFGRGALKDVVLNLIFDREFCQNDKHFKWKMLKIFAKKYRIYRINTPLIEETMASLSLHRSLLPIGLIYTWTCSYYKESQNVDTWYQITN
jgi:hypothetical protein